jgi:hypothetical protein
VYVRRADVCRSLKEFAILDFPFSISKNTGPFFAKIKIVAGIDVAIKMKNVK